MSQYKHRWFVPMHTNHRVLWTLLLSELTNKLCDLICLIFCQNTKNWYYLDHAKTRLTSKSSSPVFTVNYLLRSVFLFQAIPPSLTMSIYFNSMPIFSPLGTHSWHTAPGGRLPSLVASVPFWESRCVTGRDRSACLWGRKDGVFPSSMWHGVDHGLVLWRVSGLFCRCPVFIKLRAMMQVLESCDVAF